MSTATLPARRPIVVPPKPNRSPLTRVRGRVLLRTYGRLTPDWPRHVAEVAADAADRGRCAPVSAHMSEPA